MQMQKTTTLHLCFCALLFVLASLIPSASFAADIAGTIRGTVRAGGGSTNGVGIRLFSPGNQIPVDATITDAKGTYVFTDVAPGNYQIVTDDFGYQSQTIKVAVLPKTTIFQDIMLIKSAPPIFGCVAGRVVDICNAPRQTTVVCLIDRHRHIYSVEDTNDQGEYLFSRIPPGDYHVEFQHPGHPARKTSISVVAGETISLTYYISYGWIIPFYPQSEHAPTRIE